MEFGFDEEPGEYRVQWPPLRGLRLQEPDTGPLHMLAAATPDRVPFAGGEGRLDPKDSCDFGWIERITANAHADSKSARLDIFLVWDAHEQASLRSGDFALQA